MRALALPVAALVVSGGVVAAQFGAGGGDFVPRHPADPCTVRTATSVSTGIDGLTERLVVLGVDRAACKLGVSRESLVLTLAEQRAPTTRQVDAVRAGLLDAITLLDTAHALPEASALVDDAVGRSDLNGLVKFAIRALPDSLIDKALHTDDVLRRTVQNLDVRKALSNLDDPDELNTQVQHAVTDAVQDALVARLKNLL